MDDAVGGKKDTSKGSCGPVKAETIGSKRAVFEVFLLPGGSNCNWADARRRVKMHNAAMV